MHVSSGAYVGKAVGIGAGVGLIAGIIYDSRCHSVDHGGGTNKVGCLPIASEVFPVIGSIVGLLGGIATRPMDVPVPNDWVPATIAGRSGSSPGEASAFVSSRWDTSSNGWAAASHDYVIPIVTASGTGVNRVRATSQPPSGLATDMRVMTNDSVGAAGYNAHIARDHAGDMTAARSIALIHVGATRYVLEDGRSRADEWERTSMNRKANRSPMTVDFKSTMHLETIGFQPRSFIKPVR
ncbi:MAG: hypothetical protein ABI229_02885 [Gemmatimonadaceae bacterium]